MIRLQPRDKMVLKAIQDGHTSVEEIHDHLWGYRSDGGPEVGAVAHCVSRLRKAGHQIETEYNGKLAWYRLVTT